jgi:hypothetical protein
MKVNSGPRLNRAYPRPRTWSMPAPLMLIVPSPYSADCGCGIAWRGASLVHDDKTSQVALHGRGSNYGF